MHIKRVYSQKFQKLGRSIWFHVEPIKGVRLKPIEWETPSRRPDVRACKATWMQVAERLQNDSKSPQSRLGNVIRPKSFWRQLQKPPKTTCDRIQSRRQNDMEASGHAERLQADFKI
ncbi:uncharacterized protein PGTG_10144 [Puccinia graminis f. sp. tritici CRL 75-36-700-3]|uniref:Uncharacterized protein n=1 Tax=Puccinia graminis f. sp. tritici (strain CRL 75-36-700-3 / race SCCL) TaxID=418459 RepID=E3KJE9_PUCGT|nr:uncharacterized protein PGTG_10144 [Puccinia graminis f. sp. tritici CRL 75-36-700-3]EFP84424.1 hypothetical protein PGTG_10144 [Puccinia graminis f. sp. tritici CRL 75-36-700-3]